MYGVYNYSGEGGGKGTCVCALCEMVWGLIEFGSWHGWVV